MFTLLLTPINKRYYKKFDKSEDVEKYLKNAYKICSGSVTVQHDDTFAFDILGDSIYNYADFKIIELDD